MLVTRSCLVGPLSAGVVTGVAGLQMDVKYLAARSSAAATRGRSAATKIPQISTDTERKQRHLTIGLVMRSTRRALMMKMCVGFDGDQPGYSIGAVLVQLVIAPLLR